MAITNPAQPPGEPSESLEARLRFETLLADIASRFVHLPADVVEAEIEHAQRQVSELLGFERSTFWLLVEADPPSFSLMSVVKPADSAPLPTELHARTLFPWVTGQLPRGEAILIRRLEDLPPEAARDRQTLEEGRPR